MNSRRDDLTDAVLISSTLSGDRESFGVIVRRYQGPLLRLAHSRLGQIELAEEAVQDAFASAYRSLGSYRSEFSFRTWLWTILLNQCRQQYKRLQNRPAVTGLELDDESAVGLPAHAAGPMQLAISNERTEYIDDLLRNLPDAQHRALRLRFFGGLRYQEIADAMHCSLSTAKMRVRVGLEKLSAMLSPGEVNSLAGDSEK